MNGEIATPAERDPDDRLDRTPPGSTLGPIPAPASRSEPASGTILVTGPARSGKSEWAERLARTSGHPVIYVATAREDPEDADWTARIAAHRARRPARWLTVEAPTDLAETITAHDRAGRCLLVDSLGTWVANRIESDEAAWQGCTERLLAALGQTAGLILLVAEETGWGVIPAYPVGRRFRDRLGNLVRRLGPRCASSYLVTGGYAIELSRLGTPLD